MKSDNSGSISTNANTTNDRRILAVDLPEILHQKYRIDNLIGKGCFSMVYLAEDRIDNSKWALKVISKSRVFKKERLRSEIEILKKVNHKHIIKLREDFEDDSHIYLVQEHADGGELYEKIVTRGVYTELQASILMKKLFEAVAYLHNLNIIHRDLKPENILLIGDKALEPKIIDFGLSKLFEESNSKKKKITFSQVGSDGYTAPEILEKRGYDHSVDMWSLGIILYILISGSHPFPQNNPEEQYYRIIESKVEFPGAWKYVSPQCKNLIVNLLDKDPQKRPSANQSLKHPFISRLDLLQK